MGSYFGERPLSTRLCADSAVAVVRGLLAVVVGVTHDWRNSGHARLSLLTSDPDIFSDGGSVGLPSGGDEISLLSYVFLLDLFNFFFDF